MKKLNRSEFTQVSVMLFGLFFGAGNLIFPPLLGNQAGDQTWVALASFAITAVLFPVLGAILVGKTDGLSNLSNRVGALFSILFTTAIYLSIGPGLGIPRAGSVPFELAIAPLLPETTSLSLARLIYTLCFFGLALWICLKPTKLVKRVGKYLTPTLLVMILVLFVRFIFLSPQTAPALGAYQTSPLTKGFLSGYDTMDAVAALNFGFVVTLAIKGFGVTDKEERTRYTVKAGLVAGSLLLVVYAMLSYIGMVTSGLFPGAENGAQVLSQAVQLVFGQGGLYLLAAIFTLACLTTCVGLITSGGEYFHVLFKKKLSYRSWVLIWTFCSFVMANFGLNTLLAFSVPLLTIIYPVALVLIVMGMTQRFFGYSKLAYGFGAFFSLALPLVEVLNKTFKLSLPFLTDLVKSLPLYEEGLSWVLPSLLAVTLVSLLGKVYEKYQERGQVGQEI
ncbi:MAG: branched-chain amino acid transport system II carrier protein [Peptoniphilus sp. oral taxon 375]|nr:branched-chain amino acid transport system II carrier protein [Peptoniphilus sp. oral taxon 375]